MLMTSSSGTLLLPNVTSGAGSSYAENSSWLISEEGCCEGEGVCSRCCRDRVRWRRMEMCEVARLLRPLLGCWTDGDFPEEC